MKKILIYIISGVLIVGLGKFIINNIEDNNEISLGRENLVKLEERSITDVENEIDKYRNEYFSEKNKDLEVEINEDVIGDDENNNKYFENTIFMGDSITEGLGELGVISEYNVVGKNGDTVVKAKEHISTLKNFNPKNGVLLYGMNDVIEFYDSNIFKEKYIELINEIKVALPNANLCIISPLPVMDKATNINSRLTNSNLDEFRIKSEEVAIETNVNYINMSSRVIGKDYLHEGDGIHFKYEFYLDWLEYLKEYI